MAVSSQVFQNKRGRDEYWNSRLAWPDAKRTNSRTSGYDSKLINFTKKIDNMDNNEETGAANKVEGEMICNGVIKSLKDESGLKAQTDNNFESSDDKGSTDHMAGSNKQGELASDVISEATAVTSHLGDFTYHDDVFADLDFFVDHISPDEFEIMMQNYLDRDSVPDIMYSDTVHGSTESREASYWSPWGDDIFPLNEHPVMQNDFASPQQEGFGISVAKFHDVWN